VIVGIVDKSVDNVDKMEIEKCLDRVKVLRELGGKDEQKYWDREIEWYEEKIREIKGK